MSSAARSVKKYRMVFLLIAVIGFSVYVSAYAAGQTNKPTTLPQEPKVYLRWQPFQEEIPPLPVVTVEKGKNKGELDRLIITGVAVWGVAKKEMTLHRWNEMFGWTIPKEWKNKVLDDQIIMENPVELLEGKWDSVTFHTTDNHRLHIIFDIEDTDLVLANVQISDGNYRVFETDGRFELLYYGKNWEIDSCYDKTGQLVSAVYRSNDIIWSYGRFSRRLQLYGLKNIIRNGEWLWDISTGWHESSMSEEMKKKSKIDPEKLPFEIVGDPEPSVALAQYMGSGFPSLAGESSVPAFWPADDLSRRETPYEKLPDGTEYQLSEGESMSLSFPVSDTRKVTAYYNEYYELYYYDVSVFGDPRGNFTYTYSFYPSSYREATEPKLSMVYLLKETGDIDYSNRYATDSESPTGWRWYNSETRVYEYVEKPWFTDQCLPLELKY